LITIQAELSSSAVAGTTVTNYVSMTDDAGNSADAHFVGTVRGGSTPSDGRLTVAYTAPKRIVAGSNLKTNREELKVVTRLAAVALTPTANPLTAFSHWLDSLPCSASVRAAHRVGHAGESRAQVLSMAPRNASASVAPDGAAIAALSKSMHTSHSYSLTKKLEYTTKPATGTTRRSPVCFSSDS
jgi:hypothetical protein